ncbi:hypothetical protein [Streptomyces tropicalis]|uniref:Uncharacterized protein n=1 Tax=Streptomyces tropicalis TaxID=3034234 RepID=A0ABT6A497_9ACTN|nr:hypothetical protein [Streptomyces tropicalis]MDF3299475.1 hypothetical protein [Streptomyces tropicalis]
MNQRKDAYRAALRRRPDGTAPAADAPSTANTTVTPLETRYIKVIIELDPVVARGLDDWVGQPLSALRRAGAATLRLLRQGQ